MKAREEGAVGQVREVFGNLLQVRFSCSIQQGEIGFVLVPEGESQLRLKAEVIEICGEEAKLQVFEDTRGIGYGMEIQFERKLLEAELGPGLLHSIFDGLQNPLEELGEESDYFLPRGSYPSALNREKKWLFTPTIQVGEKVFKGSRLGSVPENHFTHWIFFPFSLEGEYTISWIAPQGEYCLKDCIAQIENESGEKHSLSMLQYWPIKKPLCFGNKVKARELIYTGMRMIDTQFPIVRGGTFCTPGPFGAGKTVLQHHLAKFSSVDIVIVVACGERAGEVVEILQEFPELEDPNSGRPLMQRTAIICNTSSMPVAARESSVYMGATIAEYYRQMGLHVLLLADSTSRWAQAMREMSGRLEEIPGEEAFPAYLSSRIAAFYERSGVIQLSKGERGSLTIGGAVSPAGGNFEEPVTQATLSVVGAFLGLSRERAHARRYPAIDPLLSWSKYLADVDATLKERVPNWGEKVREVAKMVREGDEIQKRIEVVGEESTSQREMILYLKSELYDLCYLQQNSFDAVDKYYPFEEQLQLFSLMQEILHTPLCFANHEEARHFFLALQTKIKNHNSLPFGSTQREQEEREIREKLQEKRGEAAR